MVEAEEAEEGKGKFNVIKYTFGSTKYVLLEQ